jgi:hypothetical protein
MKSEDILKSILVHHEQLGLGKISRENCNDEDVWVQFLFYAPEILMTKESLVVVDGYNVVVSYEVAVEGVSNTTIRQSQVSIKKDTIQFSNFRIHTLGTATTETLKYMG